MYKTSKRNELLQEMEIERDKEELRHMIEIQKYLSWLLLQDQYLLRFLPILDYKIFGEYEPIWKYVRDRWNGYEPDMLVVANDCGFVNKSWVIEIATEIYTWNPRKYLEKLLDMTYSMNKRKLNIDWFEELIEIKRKIIDIDNWLKWEQYYPMGISLELLDDYHAWIDKERLRLWINEIDSVLGGGLPKWNITTIGAYSNTGKSKFAYFLASNFLKQNKKVIFFNLEVNRKTAYKNILASYSGVHYDNVTDVSEYLERYNDLPLMTVDDKWDWESIKSFIVLHKPDVVFIDYVQNIEIESSSVYEQMSKIAKNIQRLAIEQNIIIINISQLSNDGAKTGNTNLIPMKWAWELVASSDVCILLKNDPMNTHLLNLTIAKSKLGRKDDMFWLYVDYKINKFSIIDSTAKSYNDK